LRGFVALLGCVLCAVLPARAGAVPAPHFSIVSGRYWQEFGRTYTAVPDLEGKDVRALAVDDSDAVWVGTTEGLFRYVAGNMTKVAGESLGGSEILSLAATGPSVYAAMPGGVVLVSPAGSVEPAGGDWSPETTRLRLSPGGVLHASGQAGLWRLLQGRWEVVGVPTRVVTDFAFSSEGVVWLASGEGLWRGSGWEWRRFTAADSGLLSDDVRALDADGLGHVWAGTAEGVNVVSPDGEGWRKLTGVEGLPWPEVLALRCAADGSVLIGTTRGCAKLEQGQWRFYHSLRWLPHDRVQAVARQRDGTLWMGTPAGVARVEFGDFTLAQKADFYQRAIDERHIRHGFVPNRNRLREVGDLGTFQPHYSDNDGQWTGLYLASQAFRYGATGEEEAHRRASESMGALLALQEVTAVPGLIARCIAWPDEEQPMADWGDFGEWHKLGEGRWWKGDASSDELVGHFFGLSVYYDLAARDQEKAKVAGALKAITDHLIAHNYCLVDVDGEPTRWGVFDPGAINGDPKWEEERALSSLELLSFLKTTYHVTGDEIYQQKYLELVRTHQYALNTIDVLQPPYNPGSYWDIELALLSFYPLLSYERDAGLRAIYQRALREVWLSDRGSRSPFLSVFASVLLGEPLDLQVGVLELQEIPVDLVHWQINNSWRKDILVSAVRSRDGELRAEEPVRAAERRVTPWDRDPYKLDGGGDAKSENSGTYWLLPYWCARYQGLILESEGGSFDGAAKGGFSDVRETQDLH